MINTVAFRPVLAAPAPPHAPDPPGYTGPADGLSHYDPEAARWLRPLSNLAMSLVVRRTVEGAENLPQSGPHMLAFNHQSYLDPPLVVSTGKRDWRFMAAKEEFTGPIGKAMTAMGAFPVDRKAPGSKPVDVSVDLLNDGHGVAIFPEGRIYGDGAVHDLKEGAALIALHSKCESVIPGAIHYAPHTPGFGSKIATYAAAVGLTAGAIAAAVSGLPALQMASAAITGAVTGAVAGGAVGVLRQKGNDDPKAVGMSALKGVGLGLLGGGAAAGAAAALLGASHPLLVAVPLALGAGLTTLAGGKWMGQRQDARIVIGKPIEVAPYKQIAVPKQARTKLTEDLHAAMVDLKKKAEG